jgi:O-antigen/teichoic acid export membrane protein
MQCDVGILISRQEFLAVFVMAATPGIFALIAIGTAAAIQAATTAVVICSWLAGNVIAEIIGWSRTGWLRRGDSRSRSRGLVQGGWSFAGSAVAEATTNRLDQVLALPLLGATQAGFYSVAVTLSVLPLMVAHSLSAAIFVRQVAVANDDRRELVERSFRLAAAACGLVAIGLAAITPVAVPLVFGQEFAPAVWPALIGIATGMCTAIIFVLSMGLAAAGRGAALTAAQVLGILTGLTLLLLLGPTWGAIGAGVASLVAAAVLLLVLSAVCRVRASAVVPTPRDLMDAINILTRGFHGGS